MKPLEKEEQVQPWYFHSWEVRIYLEINMLELQVPMVKLEK